MRFYFILFYFNYDLVSVEFLSLVQCLPVSHLFFSWVEGQKKRWLSIPPVVFWRRPPFVRTGRTFGIMVFSVNKTSGHIWVKQAFVNPLRTTEIRVTEPLHCPGLCNFRAEWCTDAPANSIFSGPMTSVFNAMYFDGNPFKRQCEKFNRKAFLV